MGPPVEGVTITNADRNEGPAKRVREMAPVRVALLTRRVVLE